MIKKLILERANRLYQMPPDLLSFIPDQERRPLLPRKQLLDLGTLAWPAIGDVSARIPVEQLRPASRDELKRLGEELCSWLADQLGITVASPRQLLLGGSIRWQTLLIAQAFIETGDLAFVPELGLPNYRRAVVAAGGEGVGYPVSLRHEWRPVFDKLTTRIGRTGRLVFLNSPHNPTGTELGERDVRELGELARKMNLLLVNDAAFVGLGSPPHRSLPALESAAPVSVEMHSFSYLLGLPPMPYGFAVGPVEVINSLKAAARLLPVETPGYAVAMIRDALRRPISQGLAPIRGSLDKARSALGPLLEMLELEPSGQATVPYLWARVARRAHATTLARLLYRRFRILVIPGVAFGEPGQEFVRLSLTAPPESYAEAAARIERRRRLLHLEERA